MQLPLKRPYLPARAVPLPRQGEYLHPGMPKASRLWICDVCGQVLPNEPKPVLSHVMSHAERRPFATSAPSRSQLATKTATEERGDTSIDT